MIDDRQSKRDEQLVKSNHSTSFRFSKADDLREIMSDLVERQTPKPDEGVTVSGGGDVQADGALIHPNPTVKVTMKNKGPTSARKIHLMP